MAFSVLKYPQIRAAVHWTCGLGENNSWMGEIEVPPGEQRKHSDSHNYNYGIFSVGRKELRHSSSI